MKPSGICMVITTVASEVKARELAGILLEKRVAACVQWFPIESMYRWKNQVEHEREFLLQAKTTTACAVALQQCIRQNHDYETPEIIELPVSDGLPEYLAWVKEQVSESGAGVPPAY